MLIIYKGNTGKWDLGPVLVKIESRGTVSQVYHWVDLGWKILMNKFLSGDAFIICDKRYPILLKLLRSFSQDFLPRKILIITPNKDPWLSRRIPEYLADRVVILSSLEDMVSQVEAALK